FTEVKGGEAAAPAAAAGGEGLPGVPRVTAGAAVGTSYLVFVDDYFSHGPNRDESLRNLKKDLGRLGRADRMAIVAYDGKKLARLAGWTGSREALAQAIDAALARPAHGLQRRGELVELDSFQAVARDVGGDANGAIAFAQRLAGQISRSVEAAVATMRSFPAPGGRRVMLLLAGGWPYSPAEYAFQ